MKKSEFFKLLAAKERLNDHIWEEWDEIQEAKPEPYKDENVDVEYIDFNYDYNWETKMIRIKTPDSETQIPLSQLLDESDDDVKLQMLWYDSYWDGPMSGLATYNGEKVYFEMDEDRYENIFDVRTHKVYKLSVEELKEIEYWHERFRKDVGKHTDYGDHEQFKMKEDESIFHSYYKDIKKFLGRKVDYGTREYLGTFIDAEFDRKPRT